MKIYLHGSESINGAADISTEDVFEYAETGIVGIVSAFRGYLSEEENNARTNELCRLILSNGFDYAEVTGSFREDGGEVDRERSIVVINYKKPDKQELIKFRKLMTGFGAKFQQDSIFIIYGKSDMPSEHKNTSYVDQYGTSSNSKVYHYENLDDSGDIDYDDYTYKETLRKDGRVNRRDIEYSFDIIGELWERKPKYEWGSEESINESVSRNEYTILRKFSHITPKEAFSAYSETIDGGAYSIFASRAISDYRQSTLRLQAKKCSGYASREAIERNRRKILASTK